MTIFNIHDDYENLKSEIKKVQEGKPIVIAIDGSCGTGKTNLAYRLAGDLYMKAIDLDDFFTPSSGDFVNELNYGLLKQATMRTYKKHSMIISGLCMLHVLNRLCISYDTLIYCKEICNSRKQWDAAEYLDINDEDKLQEKLQGVPKLSKAVYEYHFRFKPHKNCNIECDIIDELKIRL